MGIPVVYSHGTDLEEVISNHGAGIGVPEEDAGALTDSFIQAKENNLYYINKAKSKRNDAQQFFKGEKFVLDILC